VVPASPLQVAVASASPLQEAVVPASPLQEVVAPASLRQEAVAFAAAEQVGSGSARADWVQDERFRDDWSAVLTADDRSLPVAGLDGSPPADCSADSAGYSLVLSADESSPGDCLAPVESAVPQACSAVPAPADSAARERPHQDADSGPADFRDGSPAGWRAEWKRAVPVAPHSAGFPAGSPDGPRSVLPVCREAPA